MTAESCPNPRPPPADPPNSGVWFGATLDLGEDSVAKYAERLGHSPAIFNTFASIPMSARDRRSISGAADQARRAGSMVLLTLEPYEGLDAVSEAEATTMAHQVDAYNRAGVRVIVRFAHDMNGSWYPWSQDPASYVSTFRRVAAAVHQVAPASSMMWAPHYGGGYPFVTSQPLGEPVENDGVGPAVAGRYAARPGTEAYRLLDTNRDGALTHADDPYGPYWPGLEAVDWVGLSLYHWGDKYPWGDNVVPTPGKFVEQLRGTYTVPGGVQPTADFYGIYGERMQRPVAIPETAAVYVPNRGGAGALAIKRAWWRQVFADSLPDQLPWLRMIGWFEWEKYEPEVGALVDWTVTRDPDIRAALRADLPSWLRFAADVPECGTT